jgi:hypothetical protein
MLDIIHCTLCGGDNMTLKTRQRANYCAMAGREGCLPDERAYFVNLQDAVEYLSCIHDLSADQSDVLKKTKTLVLEDSCGRDIVLEISDLDVLGIKEYVEYAE